MFTEGAEQQVNTSHENAFTEVIALSGGGYAVIAVYRDNSIHYQKYSEAGIATTSGVLSPTDVGSVAAITAVATDDGGFYFI